jgi:hypothetical protein
MMSAKASASRGYQEVDPIWQQFVEADGNFNLSFSTQDPSLDQDPYFLRGQTWNSTNKNASALSYAKTAGSLDIAIPNSPRFLSLKLPLTPVQATDEFIFLSLDKSSDLFQKAAGKGEKTGEGLFFISRAELALSGMDNRPVPLFFFPLSGQGWTGNDVSALEIPQTDTLVVANKTDSVAIELRDVETAMKAQQINLMMATALTAKNRDAKTAAVYIAPGMTSSFGMFFTGLDLEIPGKSMWQADQTASFIMKHPVMASMLKKFTRLIPFTAAPSANAIEMDQKVIDRLVYVGSILAGMLAVSIVLKYAHPGIRKKLVANREGKVPKNKWELLKREVNENFSVFAETTKTVFQISSVTFGNSLELFLDKYAPAVAAGDHTLIRRFLNYTVYYSRNSVKNIPTNAKTLLLGAAVMGTVDTASVVLQYEVVVPWMANAISPHVGHDMQERIATTFDPNNPDTNKIVLQDSVRNGVSYVLTGAFSYSTDARQQVIEGITKEAEASLRARGLDPFAPQNQALKNREIEAKVDVTMKLKGLPGKEQLLFDMNSLYNKIPEALGYKTPEDMQAQESFILASRFGLSKNALKKALKAAKEWAQADNSQVNRETVALLEETLRSMNFMNNDVTDGRQGIQEARKVRQQLTLLSYEGNIEYAVRYIPETWSQKYSPEAAQTASLIFRQALYSYLNKEGNSVLIAKDQEVKSFGEQAKQMALAGLRSSHPELVKLEGAALESAVTANEKLRSELTLRTQIEINNLARAKESADAADAYVMPKQDWLARRQERRAHQEANDKLQLYVHSLGEANVTDAQMAKWKQAYYRDALAKQIGLHIESKEVATEQGREDYVKMLDFVEKKAEESTEGQIKKDLNIANLLGRSSAIEQEKIKLALYANNYLNAYKEATTDNQMVAPTDPAQPGRFQKIRQKEVVRNSKFLTRSMRVLESFMDDQTLKPGIMPALGRNIPLFQDLWDTHRRLGRSLISALGVGYVWNYHAWQTHIPYASWILLVATSPAAISTPSQWLNRMCRMQGLKAMDSIVSKIGYALPYAWVTFLGMFPILMYSPDAAALFNDFVRDPVMGVFGQVSLKNWLEIAAGTGLIAAAANSKLKGALAEKADAVRKLLRPNTSGAVMNCRQVLLK